MPSRTFVIGTGWVGEAVLREASARGQKLIALEVDPVKAGSIARWKGIQVIRIQDLSLDELRSGGVDRAGLVLATADTNEENLRIITYALELGAGRIVAIAFDEEHCEIFRRLGADRVVIPARIVAEQLCGPFLGPSILYDLVLNDGSRIVQAAVQDGSPLVGTAPAGIDPGPDGPRVIDVVRGERHLAPGDAEALLPGDVITLFASRPHGMDAALSSFFD